MTDKEKLPEGYITILPFMVGLGLSGNDLIIYAIIHGFSQDGKSCFWGGINYLMRATNLSREGVCTVLQRLVSKGLVIKKETQSIKFITRGEEVEKKTAGNAHYCLYWTAASQQNDTKEKDEALSQSEILTRKTKQDETFKNVPVRNSDPLPVRNSDSEPVRNSDPIINSKNKFNNLSLSETEKTQQEKDREETVKNCLKNIFGSDSVFSGDFVPQLEDLCLKNKIDAEKYLNWSYERVLKKNVQNPLNYFYKTALSETNAATFLYEKIKAEKQAETEKIEEEKKKPVMTTCKVCKTIHPNYEDCPECGLLYQEREDKTQLNFRKWHYFLSGEQKAALDLEVDKTRSDALKAKDFRNLGFALKAIYKKYGYEADEK